MALRRIKPNTPGSRGMTVDAFADITLPEPEPSLVVTKKRTSARNAQGRITVRHRGGGARRKIRQVDFRGTPGEAKVVGIAYDPGRSARLALLEYPDGTKRYVIAPRGLRPGATVAVGEQSKIAPGHRRTLRDIPVGTELHAVELIPGQGAQIARSAGTSAELLAKEGEHAHVRLPSGEVRLVHQSATASIGVVGNPDHQNIKLGKAGRSRRMGIRPTVRGKAMNPADHPHGGGEGQQDIGMPSPKTPWGVPTLGFKTRNRKTTDAFIVRGRKERRR